MVKVLEHEHEQEHEPGRGEGEGVLRRVAGSKAKMASRIRRVWTLAILAALAFAAGCQGRPAAGPPAAPGSSPPVPAAPSEPQQAEGQGPPILPDPRLTPGATLDVTTDDICVSGYSHAVRDVPVEVKRQVYAEYGITHHAPGEYEVDHLISLELGGSNSIKNLWPESYETEPWNAHVKDELEDELHRLVCSGQLDLKTAQHDIASDWIAAYKRYFHTDQPLTSASRHRRHSGEEASPAGSPPAGEASNPEGAANNPASMGEQVWVNTRSGKYFLPGSRYYGNTKEGEYMPEAEARQQGFTRAHGG